MFHVSLKQSQNMKTCLSLHSMLRLQFIFEGGTLQAGGDVYEILAWVIVKVYVCVCNCLLWSLYPFTPHSQEHKGAMEVTKNGLKFLLARWLTFLANHLACREQLVRSPLEEQKIVPTSFFHNLSFLKIKNVRVY